MEQRKLKQPSGLTWDPITPSTIIGFGTAGLSCRSNTPGSYTVTITATYGTTTHTATTAMTMTAASNPAPNAPNPGPVPTTLYAIVGVTILIAASTGKYLFLRT